MLLSMHLNERVYLVGAYDESRPRIGHCFATKVQQDEFYLVENQHVALKFMKIRKSSEKNACGQWIGEIRFVFPIVWFK